MSTRRPKKKKLTYNPDQEPKFERGDVVAFIGITGPWMLVTEVSDKPRPVDSDYDEDEDDEDEGALNASVGNDGFLEGEFVVTVMWFTTDHNTTYDGREFPEGLLRLVRSAALVRKDADLASENARIG